MKNCDYRDQFKVGMLPVIAKAVHRFMKEKFPYIQNIACTGSSGLTVASAMTMLSDYSITYVRKDKEHCHGSSVENMPQPLTKYVIVDDFISSGATVQRILSMMETANKAHPPQCAGIVLYAEDIAISESRFFDTNIPVFYI